MVALDWCVATGRNCRSVWWSANADSDTDAFTNSNTYSWRRIAE